ncbi:hypothetical protein AADZ91_14890 [Colwelliaceae bacterium 6441]
MKAKIIVILFVVILIVIPLFLASILGENDHIDDVVDDYFGNLKKGDFSGTCIPIFVEQGTIDKSQNTVCSNENFLLTISLLKYFELKDIDNYLVKIKRDNFWFPFISESEVLVSISLIDKDINDGFSIFDDAEYITGLFAIKRVGLSWKASSISIIEPKLLGIYKSYKSEVDFEKYLKKIDAGYKFSDIIIDSRDMTEVDKLLLRFNLQEVNQFVR